MNIISTTTESTPKASTRRRMRRGIVVSALALMITVSVAACDPATEALVAEAMKNQTTTAPATTTPAVNPLDERRAWMVNQINAHRATVGAAPVQTNSKLSAVAQSRAQKLADTRCNMATTNCHADKKVTAQNWTDPQYCKYGIGENLGAASRTPSASFSVVQNTLVASSIHLGTMRNNRYDMVGIGVAQSVNGMTYIVQEFAYSEWCY